MMARRPPVPTFIVAAEKTSVDMNGVLVPFRRCVENLQRFCRPLLLHNQGSEYELSQVGSSFLLKHGPHFLVLCSKHQLGKPPHVRSQEDITIVVHDQDGSPVGLSPGALSRIDVTAEDAALLNDIVLAEFPGNHNGRDIKSLFYQLRLDTSPDISSIPQERMILLFAIGYPSHFSSHETEFHDDLSVVDMSVTSRWCKIYLETRIPDGFDLPYRIPLRLHRDFEADLGDPDGFSGAPVFFLYQDETRQTHLGFAGMVTHAHQDGRFSVYDARYIKTLLRLFPSETLS
jgi:hypothetical protein